jgi:hypothetical protein
MDVELKCGRYNYEYFLYKRSLVVAHKYILTALGSRVERIDSIWTYEGGSDRTLEKSVQ